MEPLAPRAYQSELFCKAKEANIIAYLETGSGKTLVSIMLIKDVFETLQPGASACKAIFLVPTVGLANQQADVLRQQTPLRVGHYYGALGVDFWRLEDWRKQLEDHDVLVMTYQVLLNALSAGFIKLCEVALLVVDECHHAKKGHPLNLCFQNFYHLAGACRPRVLGMTASPIDQKSGKKSWGNQFFFKELEGNLDCKVYTVRDRSSIAQAVPLPTESQLMYPAEALHSRCQDAKGVLQDGAALLRELARQVQEKKHQSRLRRSGLLNDFGATQFDQEPPSSESLSMARALESIIHILQTLGPYCAAVCLGAVLGPRARNMFVSTAAEEDSSMHPSPHHARPAASEDWQQLLNDEEELRAHEETCLKLAFCRVVEGISELLQPVALGKLFPQGDPTQGLAWAAARKRLADVVGTQVAAVNDLQLDRDVHQPGALPLVTAKAAALVRHLESYRDVVTASHKPWCSIIFAERKLTVFGLQHLLAACPCLSFLSTAMLMGGQGSIAGMTPTAKNNEQVLARLRKGELNLLVATAVAEEGLDIVQCQVVVRFDLPKRAVEHIQSRGRARAPNSQLWLMVESGNLDQLSLIAECRRDEAAMQQHASALADPQEAADEMHPLSLSPGAMPEESYSVPRTGALLTLAEAKSRLFHYCAKLPSDRYSQEAMRPRFSTSQVSGGFQAHVYLPINSPVRTAAGNVHLNRAMAQASACLCILMQLHKMGSLNDHLVPDPEVEAPADDPLGRNEPVDQHANLTMRTPTALLMPPTLQANTATLHLHQLRALSPDIPGDCCGLDRIGLLTTQPLPQLLPLTTPLPNKDTISIEIVHAQAVEVPLDQMLRIQRAHETIVRYGAHPRKTAAQEAEGSFQHCSGMPNAGSVAFKGLWVVPVCAAPASPAKGSRARESPRKLMKMGLQIDWGGVTDAAHEGSRDLQSVCALGSDAGSCDTQFHDAVLATTYGMPQLYVYQRLRSDLSPASQMDGSSRKKKKQRQTYAEYYETTYGISDLKADQAMIDALPLNANPGVAVVQLVPELCTCLPLSGTLLQLARTLVPRALWWCCTCLTAQELQARIPIFRGCEGPRVLEALMPSRCQEGLSLERLEVLGDAVLKLLVGLHLYQQHPTAHEGQLSAWRHTRVSNAALAKLACSLQLEEAADGLQHFIAHPCSSVDFMRGHPRAQVTNVRMKVVADCLEALIGCAHESGGMQAALAFLQHIRLLPSGLNLSPPVPSSTASTSVMQRELEGRLQYNFKCPELLTEATTHCSRTDASGPCNQRLEFLGDAVLDYVVTRYFVAQHRACGPGALHDLRSATVNNTRLACAAASHGLIGHLRHFSQPLMKSIAMFLGAFDARVAEHLEGLAGEGSEPPARAHALKAATDAVVREATFGQESVEPPPKAIGDMIEALLGAVFIDSGCSFDATKQVILHLLSPLPTPETALIHPVRALGELAAKQGQQLMWQIRNLSFDPEHEAACTSVGTLDQACSCVAVTAVIGEHAIGRSDCARSQRLGKLAAAEDALRTSANESS